MQFNYEKYKYNRNKVSLLIIISEKLYFSRFSTVNLDNAKQTWEGINSLMSKSKNNAKRNAILSSIRDARSRNVLKDLVNISDVFNHTLHQWDLS